MRITTFDVVGGVCVALWIGWIGWMVAADFGVGKPERITLSPAEIEAGFREGEEWQGIYLKGQKVGYLRLRKELREDGFAMESRMVLHMTVMKTRQRIQTDFHGTMDRDMVLRDFDMEIASGPATMQIDGTVEGTVATVNFRSAGSVQTEHIELKQPPRMSFTLGHLLAAKELKPGDEVSVPLFDPASMVEREVSVRFVGVESMVIMGEEVQAWHLVQRFDRTEFNVWTNAIGEVLREDLPMGLVGIREPEAEARYGVTTGTAADAEDVIEAVAVEPVGTFAGSAPRARLRLTGLNFEGFHLDGGRQRWQAAPDGLSGTLDLQIEPLAPRASLTVGAVKASYVPDAADKALADELRKTVADEISIQATDPRIQRKAWSLVALPEGDPGLDGRNVIDVARDISTWVHGAIDKQNVIGVPSAVEVLKTLRGDCNEHATLTTALLRALGVPARMAVGIAWLESQGRFFYHAWVEVWAGGWIAIDPTFGQVPADIGHLRFIAGGLKDQVEMFRVIGNLQITVLPGE